MKIAIIGAGASGLSCAISAAINAKVNKVSVDITVFETREKVGRKILATGNGRCNLMNENEGDFYFDKNGFSCFALKKFDVRSNIEFFIELGLYTRSDEEGRIYPLSNQATSVLDALRFGCDKYKVKLVCDCDVKTIKKVGNKFQLDEKGSYDCVVLACGGKAGVKAFNGYELLKQTGHNITQVYPSLTKFEVKDKKFTKQLKGVRQKGRFTLVGPEGAIAEEAGELLFADYGISGIAVMQLSAFAVRSGKIGNLRVNADFVSEMTFDELYCAVSNFAKSNPHGKLENLLSGFVAKKLGEAVIKSYGFNLSDSFSSLDDKKLKAIVSRLKKYTFELEGVKSFDDAQVTAGGADTKYFNPKTMESKKVKGLYCVGELLDVDGLCGGYNLHWAWSSGRLCGESIIKEQLNRKG